MGPTEMVNSESKRTRHLTEFDRFVSGENSTGTTSGARSNVTLLEAVLALPKDDVREISKKGTRGSVFNKKKKLEAYRHGGTQVRHDVSQCLLVPFSLTLLIRTQNLRGHRCEIRTFRAPGERLVA